jgi:hypothetical protein
MTNFVHATEYDVHMYAKIQDLIIIDFYKQIHQVLISWNFIQGNNVQQIHQAHSVDLLKRIHTNFTSQFLDISTNF